ncbi:Uma2 family endonuclease [Nocardia pseudobrasiliensis]|uniref:Uma2 family endonuclease n=1 Tax=Nocardia pseudobrasiliensis TaxID=45979 RepID=A0A370IF28_9NOCA|nr:Uma2 family endonuclease [Nocardia pseudobrasiliensis]RDI68741.1 Uma2 family endonuclease [Nocardia pseudobrasiliensis]
MAAPHVEQPDLPEYMTWEELERLPEEIAEQIELWEGRVVWLRRGPAEHQTFMRRLTNGFESCARKDMSTQTEHCWRVDLESNVFFGASGKSDFVTPDFLVYRCLSGPYQDIRSVDVALVGEVLSPSNTQTIVEAKKARYASAGIPWYWEVALARESSAIEVVKAYGLETQPGDLPEGVHPLYPANYLLVGEWTQADADGVQFDHPFPITIPWSDLEF